MRSRVASATHNAPALLGGLVMLSQSPDFTLVRSHLVGCPSQLNGQPMTRVFLPFTCLYLHVLVDSTKWISYRAGIDQLTYRLYHLYTVVDKYSKRGRQNTAAKEYPGVESDG